MKKIAIHDSDNTGYPNLALMKISAWYKSKGDMVSWFYPLLKYDKVYSSQVFTFTKKNTYLPIDAEIGGTGYLRYNNLPEEIEHICPDYSLYNIDYSLGFTTRGCVRKCDWCVVPYKEGGVRAHADIDEFTRHKNIVLMDNNILSHQHGIEQIEKISKAGLALDINQGLDARLIDNDMAKVLSKVKWLAPLRLACDSVSQIENVRKAIENLRWNNVTPARYFCYVLVVDVKNAIEVVRFLKSMNVDPFAQAYRDQKNTEIKKEQKDFCRWVNHKAEFKSRTWEDYKERIKLKSTYQE